MPRGANRPNQLRARKPLRSRPTSVAVGVSGRSGRLVDQGGEHLAGLGVGHEGGIEHHLDAAVEHVAGGIDDGLVGRMLHLDAGGPRQHFAGEMGDRAEARGAEPVFAGVGFRQRHEFGPVPRTQSLGEGDDQDRGREPRDGDEVVGIVGHLSCGGRDRHDRGRRQEQRVAVGRCRRDHLRADAARGAGLVLHDDLLTERCAHLLGIEAGHLIGRAAGPVGHDQADRLGGPVCGLSLHTRRRQRGKPAQRHLTATDHRSLPGTCCCRKDSGKGRGATARGGRPYWTIAKESRNWRVAGWVSMPALPSTTSVNRRPRDQ